MLTVFSTRITINQEEILSGLLADKGGVTRISARAGGIIASDVLRRGRLNHAIEAVIRKQFT